MKKSLTGLVVVLIALLLISSNVSAQTNIQYIKAMDSKQEIVIKQGDKLLLDKEWYDYTFEINPKNVIGKAKIKEVGSGEYQRALEEVDFPLEKLGEYKVYFLDYRLKEYPTAQAVSFMDNSVVIFGTYYPLSKVKVHQMALHELGHQVDFSLMDQTKWQEYRQLRGITDQNKYNNAADTYEDRPQEIFAEDFRILCGGETATESPHLNQKLLEPEKVLGLAEFFAKLTAQ